MRHSELIERMGLPASPDVERMLLGQILLQNSIFPAIAEIVHEQDFSRRAHMLIWRAIASMHGEGKSIDRVSLAAALDAAGHLDAAGGLAAIAELDSGLPPFASPERWAEIVAEKADARRAITTLDAALQKLLQGNPVTSTLCGLGASLSRFDDGEMGKTAPIRAGEILESVGLDSLIRPAMAREGAIELPWPSVRDLIPALEPTELMILAARPGLGKTAAAVQIGIHAARQGHGVLMFSLEMALNEILSRMIAERGQVNMHKFACGWQPKETERHQIHQAATEIGELPFFLDQQLSRTVTAIARATRNHIRTHPGTRLVIVDYLQLAGSDSSRANRNEQISEISRGLKLLAMEMNVAILALSQLSRDSEKGERAPRLSDLRDSGAIEQDANIVAFLHNKGGAKDTDQPTTSVDFIVAKNRKGALRTRSLTFLRNTTTFIDGGNDDD